MRGPAAVGAVGGLVASGAHVYREAPDEIAALIMASSDG
jgi:hypothetical protein